MDNWGTDEKQNQGKNTNTTKKILVAIMILLVLIIIVIVALLYIIKSSTFTIAIDGRRVPKVEGIITTANDTTYISISDLAGLLGYEYHVGEYKDFSTNENKCYIQSEKETASYYLNSNKVCKLKVNNFTEDYEVFNCEKNTIEIENKLYAPIDAIQIGFNIKIETSSNKMMITTLNTLLANIDSSLNNGAEVYKSLLDEEFDNQKAALYDYIILSKKDSALYGVITMDGTEILPDKYTSIKFLESTKEFLVTNSLGKIGIVDENGRSKIDQIYDSIKVIASEPKLYLVEANKKFGVMDGEGNTIVYPEYDSIGADNKIYTDLQNQYILLDRVIPVCQNNKYGLFDLQGNKILDVMYDKIGSDLTAIDINGVTKSINPTIVVEECDGIVVKSGETYGLFSTTGKQLVPVQVKGIYYINSNGKKDYYMVYNNEEINLIQRLIDAKVIKAPNTNTSTNVNNNNTVNNNTINNTVNNVNNNMEKNINNHITNIQANIQ